MNNIVQYPLCSVLIFDNLGKMEDFDLFGMISNCMQYVSEVYGQLKSDNSYNKFL